MMTAKKTTNSFPVRNRGFTLMEILIALLILAIGLLGMAGLQVTGLRNSMSSGMRTEATFLAEDMADRMRSNMDGVTAGSYNALDTASLPTDPGCIASGCTISELAAHDINEWATLVAALPGGRAQVTNAPGNNVFRIRVMWDDNRTGATGVGCSGNPAVDLICFDMEFRP
jgi:type IV pilus assembly protein PilV